MSIKLIWIGLWLMLCLPATADDGYRLWLKYDLIPDARIRNAYIRYGNYISCETAEPVAQTALQELQAGLQGLLGKSIPLQSKPKKGGGGIVLQLVPKTAAQDLGDDGFAIRLQSGDLQILAQRPAGLLYGAFELMRGLQTLRPLAEIAGVKKPRIQFRMLNHWDNVNGSIERGYAGSSLWKWYELPETLDPRYTDYARANASLGINAVALNNVNASPRFLTSEYLPKVKALADLFRRYGIQVFLSINFASPKILDGLPTSDPADPRVSAWWKERAAEIYRYIPDFGGFLVKANSEGEPGPQEYGRSHADGANMLAKALEPHGGLVIWRAFVYSPNPEGDRFREAYQEFKPLDGQFAANVVVQVKNGPIDFQPREPFHPLFGAMPRTPLAMEFQITQEYLGFSTNLVYLAPLFRECLEADTYAAGKGSTVARVVDGSVFPQRITMMAGVANTGSDRNWTGHPMSQANWYAFGRLAWNPDLSPEQIAEEWIKMTLTKDPKALETIQSMMMRSRQVYVDFTTPLGLHHVMGQNIHFGPEPWLERSARPDWTSIYYHRADSAGIGFDRTAGGSNALGLYHPEVQKAWGDPQTCAPDYLLWFHHLPWSHRLSSGRSLWDEFCTRYYQGVEAVEQMQRDWAGLKVHLDPQWHADVAGRLAVQHREALIWRDACVLYFQTKSGLPIPAPFQKPERSLEEMKKIVRIYQLR